MKPLVRVVVLNYTAASCAGLPGTLERLEVVVFDNGSEEAAPPPREIASRTQVTTAAARPDGYDLLPTGEPSRGLAACTP